jgi:hypothetical protein
MTPDWGFVSIEGQKRRWGAYCSDSCPHYSKCEAFFVYEPFVEVEHRWCIEETPTDCVQATLRENEVADLSGEARCDERCNNNDETENRRYTTNGWPRFEDVQRERRNEIHAS